VIQYCDRQNNATTIINIISSNFDTLFHNIMKILSQYHANSQIIQLLKIGCMFGQMTQIQSCVFSHLHISHESYAIYMVFGAIV